MFSVLLPVSPQCSVPFLPDFIAHFQWRSWLWCTIEYPWTSKLAQVLALFSLFMVIVTNKLFFHLFPQNQVVISTVTFIISTAEELQKDEEGRVDFPRIVLIIDLIDNFVVIFFTIEFLARLTVCPNKKRYW